VSAGETLAVLGESGSGKSVTAQAIMGILDMPPGKIPQGEILFRGEDHAEDVQRGAAERSAAEYRDDLPDALSSSTPCSPWAIKLGEMYRVHMGLSARRPRPGPSKLMDKVKIPAAKERSTTTRTSFSGGMRSAS